MAILKFEEFLIHGELISGLGNIEYL